ncbi:MAG: hypothetical protein HOL98_12920 [Gammaproteobacteria bacterium]|jgi:hypothetical protein|nr:hypothetical protein [Gammaproteobacteria bacterium]MBT5204351.1 hypothetical protein [Gammaproteobacteria bacterium]MBT5604244.1 hypothetical protein [Gammaproteobacteria bacterium]MBT6247305.1 hypothetical protein [Gammaproteobacteria bacterium]
MTTPFIVIVRFQTTAQNQATVLQQIDSYVDKFLRHFSGFLGSTLHSNTDGSDIVHYASWQQEADFRAFAEAAVDHPDLPILRSYQPMAAFYQISHQYKPASASRA